MFGSAHSVFHLPNPFGLNLSLSGKLRFNWVGATPIPAPLILHNQLNSQRFSGILVVHKDAASIFSEVPSIFSDTNGKSFSLKNESLTKLAPSLVWNSDRIEQRRGLRLTQTLLRKRESRRRKIQIRGEQRSRTLSGVGTVICLILAELNKHTYENASLKSESQPNANQSMKTACDQLHSFVGYRSLLVQQIPQINNRCPLARNETKGRQLLR